jgi:hypothetical protein
MANNSPLSCLRRRLEDNRVDQKVAFCQMVINQPVSGASRQNTFVYLPRSITQSVNESLIFGAAGVSLGLFHLTLGTPGPHFVEVCIMPSSFFARTPTLSPASSRSSSSVASSPPSLPSRYILPTPLMRRNLSYGSCSSLTDMDMDDEETLKLPPIQGLGRSVCPESRRWGITDRLQTQRHKRLRSISAASSGFHVVDRKHLDL